MKICIKCGIEAEKGRRYCRACYLLRRQDLYKQRGQRYTYGKSNCEVCGKEISLWRKESTHRCRKCTLVSTNPKRSAHVTNRSYLVRKVFSEFLGRTLTYNEVVHHLDEDIENNSADNLILLSRQVHGALHAFLRKRRASLEKSSAVNDENCWNILRAELTTAYLEMSGAKVIKIIPIGQSAAEPLLNAEGSETMYVGPKSNRHGHDRAQTTTETSGLRNQE